MSELQILTISAASATFTLDCPNSGAGGHSSLLLRIGPPQRAKLENDLYNIVLLHLTREAI
ncbi:hypothetical protein GCM10007392_23910 [Saccharospirillum salsuginis]|uniref:Uncharacterized protein n=1 Tax=Saccharospirillum salsuginis TaxID=418750 RepID=A0A918KAV8_9GAMM|nr:hypothetical protein GCM10007392_23910 [Saccharospirillum salsuginis]